MGSAHARLCQLLCQLIKSEVQKFTSNPTWHRNMKGYKQIRPVNHSWRLGVWTGSIPSQFSQCSNRTRNRFSFQIRVSPVRLCVLALYKVRVWWALSFGADWPWLQDHGVHTQPATNTPMSTQIAVFTLSRLRKITLWQLNYVSDLLKAHIIMSWGTSTTPQGSHAWSRCNVIYTPTSRAERERESQQLGRWARGCKIRKLCL